MAGTIIRAPQNTFKVTSGGTVPDALIMPDFAGWADYVEPDNTPILSAIPRGGARNQRTFFWGQDIFTPHSTVLASAIADGVASTFTVRTGDGVLFQKFTKAAIIDLVAGSAPPRYDETKKEIVWLAVDPTGDACNSVARGQGSTTPIAHPAGSLVEILAVSEPQLQDHTISPTTEGIQYKNTFERLGGGIRMDKARREMPTYAYAGDQLLNDIEKETKRLKVLLEKTVIRGGRQDGNPTTPLPEMMAGFLSFIQTNVYTVAGTPPANLLSVPVLESAMRDLWTKVDDSAKKMWLMSMNTAAIFDTFLNPARQVQADVTQITYYTEKIKLRTGVYDFTVSRWFPDGIIAVTDFSEMSLVNFEGLDWHQKVHSTNGEYDWMSISGDFSLQVKNERAMGIIQGFNTNIDAYPGRDYLT